MKKLLIVFVLFFFHNVVFAETLTITTANKSLQGFLSDLVYEWGYQDQVDDGQGGKMPNPQTKAEYGIEKMEEYVAGGYDIEFFYPPQNNNHLTIRIEPDKAENTLMGFARSKGWKPGMPITPRKYSLLEIRKFLRNGYERHIREQQKFITRQTISNANNYTQGIEVID
jgi:hypothetical protein